MGEVQVVYNTPYEMPLGILIAIYFYFTGLSAGSFVISVIATIGGKVEYKPLGKIGAVLAPVLLIIAPTFLLVDLEQPFRFWHLFLYMNVTSPITYGSFLLTLYPMNGIAYAYCLFAGRVKWAKILGLVGIPVAVCTHGYTGFILALGKGRALWSTALMPTLFIVSAMVSGFALVILIAVARWRWFSKDWTAEDKERDRGLILGLGKYLGGTIAVDLFLVGNAILVLLTSSGEALKVAQLMLYGEFASDFIGVELVLGGLVPLLLLFVPRFARELRWVSLASVLTLIGVFSMRYVVVIAGQSLPLH